MSELKEFVYPDCHLCRGLRAALSIGAALVLLTYAAQLIQINIEVNQTQKKGG